MRKKAGVSAEERLRDEVFNSPCFSQRITPQFLRHFASTKVQGVEGDISLPGLGLKPEDRRALVENVEVMINVAATIEFTMPFKYSIPINIGGAVNNLDLAQECKHLLIYSHVSTAYANSEKPKSSYVKEEVYDHPFDVEEYI